MSWSIVVKTLPNTYLELAAYAIRLKSNAVLERQIEHLLTRPVGRPRKKPAVSYHDFLYQAGSWDKARRVVAKSVGKWCVTQSMCSSRWPRWRFRETCSLPSWIAMNYPAASCGVSRQLSYRVYAASRGECTRIIQRLRAVPGMAWPRHDASDTSPKVAPGAGKQGDTLCPEE
jgi:hypothetical protein